jgi:RNA polymerase sigma factor (sigma-70 family)
LQSDERAESNDQNEKSSARPAAANLIAETGHFPIVMESKTTMTPQSANAPEEDPSKRKARFVCNKKAVLEIYPVIQAFIICRLGWQIGEDVTHEAVGAILAGLPKITATTKRKFRAFCFRVARNKISDALRSKYGNRAEAVDPLEIAKAVEAGMDDVDEASPVYSDMALLDAVLAASKSTCREVLVEFFIADLEYEQIAFLHDTSKDAVRMKINRCLEEAKRIAKNYERRFLGRRS